MNKGTTYYRLVIDTPKVKLPLTNSCYLPLKHAFNELTQLKMTTETKGQL